MAPPMIAEGTCYVLFAYDVAHAFDLAAAERRLASATQRQTVKQKRRAPAFFEYPSPGPDHGAPALQHHSVRQRAATGRLTPSGTAAP